MKRVYSGRTPCYTRFVPKVIVLIFYLNVYWTHLQLQVISFPWEVAQWFQRFFH